MGKVNTTRKPVKRHYYGKRTGTKRSDMRWTAPDGTIWDSRYEYIVYSAYQAAGYTIRKCDKRDTFSFTLPIRNASCTACGSTAVGQSRTYTPDFHVTPKDIKCEAVGYYCESKGYLRPKQRALLRNFYKAHPHSGVRFLLQRDFPATKASSIVQWFVKFLKGSKIAVWDGKIPEGW